MSFVIVAALVITVVAAVAIPLLLAVKASTHTLSLLTVSLLWVAGILSGLMTLAVLAAAAWGMDTRVPWGLGVYPYLIPALSLPAFLLLPITSLRVLSRVLWFLTVACALAWYFGDKADRIAYGLRPIASPLEKLGMFLNAFTILFIMISLLVQLAALCGQRRQRQIDGLESTNSLKKE